VLKYTICFIIRDRQCLLLNRHQAPVQGLWHGIGGKLEKGEKPADGVIREVREETGIELAAVTFKGLVTWKEGGEEDGMYAFIAHMPKHFEYATPREVREGILAWKDLSWMMAADNQGVAAHVKKFLPVMLTDPHCYEHRCVFAGSRLIGYRASLLEADIKV
jgi:8-oxo-dGTP diphosphatase